MTLLNMKTLCVLVIAVCFCHANDRIEFGASEGTCLNAPDFCSCGRIWVTCDCQAVNKTAGSLFRNTRFIKIKNCQQLTVPRGSFRSGGSLRVTFHNIKNLILAAGAFETIGKGSTSIVISKSSLSEIPGGLFDASGPGTRDPRDPTRMPSAAAATQTLVLQVTDSEIGRIAPGAFARLVLNELTIANTTIGRIDTGAVDNQLQRIVNFVNDTFESLGRRAVVLHSLHKNANLMISENKFKGSVPQFLEGTIKGDVYINNNSFPRLSTSPWRLKVEGEATVQGNIFALLPRYGIDLTVRKGISLVDNDFRHLGPEAFLRIAPAGSKTNLFLDGNLIHQQEPLSLCLNETFSPKFVVIKHVRFQLECNCDITTILSKSLDIKNLTYEAIYKNSVHDQWFKNGECLLKGQGISHITIDQFVFHSCLLHNGYVMEILLACASVLVVIALCVIVAWRRMKRTPSTANPSSADYLSYTDPCPPSTAPGPWLVVQPDTRTYQETEIHVVFDKAEEIAEDGDEDEKSDGKTKGIKRSPSPSARQSCPAVLADKP